MGQAKQKGTFEQRKALAIERDRLKEEAYQAERKAKWDAMTPEEQKEYTKKRNEARTLIGLAMNIGNI